MRSPMRSPRDSSRVVLALSFSGPFEWGGVGVVGGDDGGALVVVAGVEDVGDGIPDPVGGLGRAELVEDKDFGFEDGSEDLQLGGGDLGVVAVLDLLEEVAVVDEEAVCAALGDQGPEDSDGEMGLAYADGAGDEQALAVGLEWDSFRRICAPAGVLRRDWGLLWRTASRSCRGSSARSGGGYWPARGGGRRGAGCGTRRAACSGRRRGRRGAGRGRCRWGTGQAQGQAQRLVSQVTRCFVEAGFPSCAQLGNLPCKRWNREGRKVGGGVNFRAEGAVMRIGWTKVAVVAGFLSCLLTGGMVVSAMAQGDPVKAFDRRRRQCESRGRR